MHGGSPEELTAIIHDELEGSVSERWGILAQTIENFGQAVYIINGRQKELIV